VPALAPKKYGLFSAGLLVGRDMGVTGATKGRFFIGVGFEELRRYPGPFGHSPAASVGVDGLQDYHCHTSWLPVAVPRQFNSSKTLVRALAPRNLGTKRFYSYRKKCARSFSRIVEKKSA
jgi:hypothetical protein